MAVMKSVPGVVGARMMGGGRGPRRLLQRDALDALRRAVEEFFFQDEHAGAEIVPLSFAPGARLLTEEIALLVQ
ncbi:MAG: hypothetical protein R2848_06725 [Thermomicrobiales bacterium]